MRDLRDRLPCCREFDILENGKKIGYAFDNEHIDGWVTVIAGRYAFGPTGVCRKERVLAQVRDYIARMNSKMKNIKEAPDGS